MGMFKKGKEQGRAEGRAEEYRRVVDHYKKNDSRTPPPPPPQNVDRPAPTESSEPPTIPAGDADDAARRHRRT